MDFIDRANQCPNPLYKVYTKPCIEYNAANRVYTIRYLGLKELLSNKHLMEAMFDMVRKNMKKMYEKCLSWNEEEKQAEFLLENGKYLIVMEGNVSETKDLKPEQLIGLCYFRFEVDGSADVIYCLELQIDSQNQKMGIGFELMKILDNFGLVFQMDYIMLTCFKTNPAIHFYYKLGFEIDETSPSQHGELNETYEILSKDCPTSE